MSEAQRLAQQVIGLLKNNIEGWAVFGRLPDGGAWVLKHKSGLSLEECSTHDGYRTHIVELNGARAVLPRESWREIHPLIEAARDDDNEVEAQCLLQALEKAVADE